MKRLMFTLIVIPALITSTHRVTYAQTYPPNAIPGGRYVVPRSESTLDIQDIVLPDNFTIVFAADVTVITWKTVRLQYGQNVTIDLSRDPRPTASPGSRGADAGGQAVYGAKAAQGGTGGTGGSAAPPRSLTINVTTLSNTSGSLWIRTDGANGGVGGPGGKGQRGSGSCCSGMGVTVVQIVTLAKEGMEARVAEVEMEAQPRQS